MKENFKEDWLDISLVKDLNYIKTGVEKYDSNKKYYSTGSIKNDSIVAEGIYNYSDRPSRANRIGKLGDVLQARMKGTDKAILIDTNFNQQLFSTGFFQIRPNQEKLLSKYIFYYFKSFLFLNEKDKNCSGSTQSALNDKSAKQLNIPLAPIPIQKTIVKKIEELFSSLDSGISDLKKAQDQLIIYRQAVLKKAFEGELTKKWRTENEIVTGWKEVNLSEISDACLGKMLDRKKNKGVLKPYLGNINVRWGKFDIDSLKTMRFEDSENDRFQLSKGDLVICEGGEPGRCAVWQGKESVFIQKALHRVRFNTNCNPFYFYYYFFYQAKVGGLDTYFTGTTIKHLTGRKLKEFKVPLFSKQEQNKIVQEIESRLSVCDTVEKDIADSLEKAKALRQSILKKAFEGKLLNEEEIAKCKEHQDYEPASVLLEKIKEEKSGITTTTKKSRPKKKKTVKKKPPAPQKISTDIQAGVISKVIQLHEENAKYLDNLTHVKCEKISHLVEYHLQIPLGRVPVKDAAGPDDYNRLKKVEHRASRAGYFKVVKKEIGHTYSTSRNITKAINNLENKVTEEQKKQLDNLINLFLKFDLETAEIIATLYAGWNNLLIDGKSPSDDEIVYESRENWSKRKLGIKRERFYKVLEWMRKDEIGLVPKGYGALVSKPKK